MERSKTTAQGAAARPRRPVEESFFAAKVDGIMRIAGFVRGDDGHWHKPVITAATPSESAGVASPNLSKPV
jgi:hypothetical protein